MYLRVPNSEHHVRSTKHPAAQVSSSNKHRLSSSIQHSALSIQYSVCSMENGLQGMENGLQATTHDLPLRWRTPSFHFAAPGFALLMKVTTSSGVALRQQALYICMQSNTREALTCGAGGAARPPLPPAASTDACSRCLVRARGRQVLLARVM